MPACGVHRARELGGQHDALAAVAEDLAEARLGAAPRVAVSVRLVEKVDAEIERLVHDLPCLLEVDTAAEIVAAEPDHGDAEPGLPEISLFHKCALFPSQIGSVRGRQYRGFDDGVTLAYECRRVRPAQPAPP